MYQNIEWKTWEVISGDTDMELESECNKQPQQELTSVSMLLRFVKISQSTKSSPTTASQFPEVDELKMLNDANFGDQRVNIHNIIHNDKTPAKGSKFD